MAINQAFTITKSFDIIKLLYENEQISEDSTIAAFRKAFETSRKYDLKRDKTRIDTVKYLSKVTCIPAEVIGEAFSHAAEHHDIEIMSFLREDARLSRNQVFLAAAMFDHRKLLKAVYDVERISPETILTAFTESSTYAEISKDISKYLCQRSHVPQAMRHKAFIHAAKRGWAWALKMLNMCEKGDMPLSVLKESLAISKGGDCDSYIRKTIRDQLFNGKVKCACGFGKVIHKV